MAGLGHLGLDPRLRRWPFIPGNYSRLFHLVPQLSFNTSTKKGFFGPHSIIYSLYWEARGLATHFYFIGNH